MTTKYQHKTLVFTNPNTVRTIFIIMVMFIIIMEFIEEEQNIKCSQFKINEVVSKIVKQKEKKIHHRLADSCKSGMLRGCVTGGINGGLEGMIAGGVMFGIANPIITYLS